MNDQRRCIHAGFSIRFDSRKNESGGWVWQTYVRHHESGEQILLPEEATPAWVSWIVEHANLPNLHTPEPIGENMMMNEVKETIVSRQQKIATLYHKEMAQSGTDGPRSEPLASITEMSAMTGEDAHTPVSNEAHNGGFIEAELSAYGERGAPQHENSLEVESGAAPMQVNLESFSEAMAEEEELLLDVWHAEFSDPATRALLRHKPVNEVIQETLEIILDEDDRIQVTGITENYPWRCICSLRIVANDGSAWIGTGWLVGPRTVITAGHCVYIHSRGGWVRSIEVIPGRDGSERPFDSCVATSFRSVTGWTGDNLRACDYGAILLPADCRCGDELGWFGYGHYEDGALDNTVVNLSGYPGDKPAGTQWFHSRQVQQLTPTTIVYPIDTISGQSGSPVWWLTEDGSRIAVGIHTNGALTGNSATRITQEVFNNIQDWKAQGE